MYDLDQQSDLKGKQDSNSFGEMNLCGVSYFFKFNWCLWGLLSTVVLCLSGICLKHQQCFWPSPWLIVGAAAGYSLKISALFLEGCKNRC